MQRHGHAAAMREAKRPLRNGAQRHALGGFLLALCQRHKERLRAVPHLQDKVWVEGTPP